MSNIFSFKRHTRWTAVITYSTDNGPSEVTYDIEELDDIQFIVERGPDWNSIMDIRITLARRAYDVTVEEAREL